ncbi:DNA methyltransferase [Seonamhaeicola sp. ML3]|uniref:DNA methyltransferase n=1 Tax=Seonamhaeicola sp. ML3 TaxID=2937786 RepID=UPI00201024AE|nr:DNA methyltransferase [Seonamhaeicola sp. ML3]
MKQKRDRYEMHKYWGKKPSNNLKELIEKYSNEGDTVLDPFSGYGVFCSEAYILNRNVISNDLNPVANYINVQLLEKDIDLKLLEKQWEKIKTEFQPFNEKWFSFIYNEKQIELTTILRDKNDVPLMGKFKPIGSKKCIEFNFSKIESNDYLEFEKNQKITDWFPTTELIQNSRISAKIGMNVSDLFTKRTLACHARLLHLIDKHSKGKEKDFLKVAFTANLANCSKLLPPIKSRGPMAPGAWMTGFYIGETYLENNVLHYFENRLKKIIKGKQDFLNQFEPVGEFNFYPIEYSNSYQTLQNDAKSLNIKSDSIDYVFTDPPYGDAVPYFEQSVIWNSWLKFIPDYENEIVISDSKEREKDINNFEKEINQAFSEIRRVLKPNKYFSLTYHSLSGSEWKAITNACIKNGFELKDYEWLVQKSFTPRQINRLKTVKGDVLVTLQKNPNPEQTINKTDKEVAKLFKEQIELWLLEEEGLDTNEIFLRIMKKVFSDKIIIGDVDLLKILTENFEFSEQKQWILNDQFELQTT